MQSRRTTLGHIMGIGGLAMGISGLGCALALSGCAPKTSATAPTQTPLRAHLLVFEEHQDDREIEAAPTELRERLLDAMVSRQLDVNEVGADQFKAPLTTLRTTAHRLTWLTQQGDTDVLVMVLTRVRFYSQLTGRYRWTVSVEASIAHPDGTDAETITFDVPVFLQFHHEREPAALVAASAVIERRVGALLDDWLGGQ